MGFVKDAVGAITKPIGGIIGDLSGSMTAQNQYQATAAPIQTQQLQPQIDEQYKALLAQQQQQQAFADALKLQMQGQGPNPAQAQYQQNVNQLAAQQAGAIASQKGISPALQARMIAQQGGQAMQNAAGQQATLQAQQQLAAQAQLQQQQAQMANQSLGAQQTLQGAFANQNQAINTSHGAAQAINSGIAQSNASAVNKTQGSLLNAAGNAVMPGAGSAMSAGGGSPTIAGTDIPMGMGPTAPGRGMGLGMMAHGGMVGNGPISGAGKYFKSGGMVPGSANKPGDNYANDTVNAKLSPGEIVIPRSIAQGKNAPDKAAEFVAAILNKKKMSRK